MSRACQQAANGYSSATRRVSFVFALQNMQWCNMVEENEESGWIGDKAKRMEQLRQYKYLRQPYCAEDMLIAIAPNKAGLYPSFPYDGDAYDENQYRLIHAGWDHDHCAICSVTIEPGDEWWAAEPPSEIGLYLGCNTQFFNKNGDT